LPGSHCPHYDGEPERRPSYQRFVAAGEIAPGVACDDGAAMHYVGDELPRAIAARPSARAYNVERVDGAAVETPLDMSLL
jgi:dipeptidase E